MCCTSFVSASWKYLEWLQAANARLLHASPGKIKPGTRAYVLVYAKADSQALFTAMYGTSAQPLRLQRKYTKFRDFISADPYAKIAIDARVL